MKGHVLFRERKNQPSGYAPGEHANQKQTLHFCKKHNYVYYPESWTDSTSGTSYQKGYYDENGTYYKSVVFKKDGCYKNILCVCDYCDTEIYKEIDDGKPLRCPQCGANMRIESELDEYLQDPAYTAQQQESVGESSGSNAAGMVFWLMLFFVIGIFLLLISRPGQRAYVDRPAVMTEERSYVQTEAKEVPSNVDIFGQTIYLDAVGENTYVISEDGAASYDKKLSWDYGEASYYDRDTDSWAWYNTDVSPNLWQYWYEGISSDFGDYGWMEYEPDGWYIERTDRDWIPLPDRYDSAALWHFEIDPGDFD